MNLLRFIVGLFAGLKILTLERMFLDLGLSSGRNFCLELAGDEDALLHVLIISVFEHVD